MDGEHGGCAIAKARGGGSNPQLSKEATGVFKPIERGSAVNVIFGQLPGIEMNIGSTALSLGAAAPCPMRLSPKRHLIPYYTSGFE